MLAETEGIEDDRIPDASRLPPPPNSPHGVDVGWGGRFEDMACGCQRVVCMESVNFMQWVRGTWKMFNDRCREPLEKAFGLMAGTRHLCCLPRSWADGRLQHALRKCNVEAGYASLGEADFAGRLSFLRTIMVVLRDGGVRMGAAEGVQRPPRYRHV